MFFFSCTKPKLNLYLYVLNNDNYTHPSYYTYSLMLLFLFHSYIHTHTHSLSLLYILTYACLDAYQQPMNTWDTSQVTDFHRMFYLNDHFDIDISTWVYIPCIVVYTHPNNHPDNHPDNPYSLP